MLVCRMESLVHSFQMLFGILFYTNLAKKQIINARERLMATQAKFSNQTQNGQNVDRIRYH